MKVIKRDGRKQEFNKDRIINAILAAFEDVDGEITQFAKDKARDIANYVQNLDKKKMSVEEIQDIVEEKLMASSRKDVAKNYIIYRNKRNKVREYNTDFMKYKTVQNFSRTILKGQMKKS